MILQSLLSIAVLLSWTILADQVTHGGRHKRILNGRETRDRSGGYAVSRYVVWMTHTAVCSNLFPSWDSLAKTVTRCDVDVKQLRCGGALLTHKIVQTACHCLADKGSPRAKGELSPYKRIIVEERRFYIFAGWTKVEDMAIGYGATGYIINERCANLNFRQLPGGEPFPIMHDYGLMVLRSPVDPFPYFIKDATNRAPYYKIAQLEIMWKRILSKELTCLFVGYGLGTKGSSELGHGWGVMRNYLKCIRLVDVPLKTKVFNYTDDATWYCSTPLPSHSDRVVRGDSGSPVTCDNEYVGLVSQTVSENSGKVDLTSPLVFSIFENSEEYRSSLIVEETFAPVILVPKSRAPFTRPPNTEVDDFSLRSTSHTSNPARGLICIVIITTSIPWFSRYV
ncbi:hypothetical protein GE061_003674 [Apolygus lucorum]|uniref:Uncharacterized protein n=1 Tax=Apolygus lucorum TaxID=248454 RepID=A0A6A4JLL1_APOLU|nr:hypothetical protein GE061_003674 [Apolygus lucorum]